MFCWIGLLIVLVLESIFEKLNGNSCESMLFSFQTAQLLSSIVIPVNAIMLLSAKCCLDEAHNGAQYVHMTCHSLEIRR